MRSAAPIILSLLFSVAALTGCMALSDEAALIRDDRRVARQADLIPIDEWAPSHKRVVRLYGGGQWGVPWVITLTEQPDGWATILGSRMPGWAPDYPAGLGGDKIPPDQWRRFVGLIDQLDSGVAVQTADPDARQKRAAAKAADLEGVPPSLVRLAGPRFVVADARGVRAPVGQDQVVDDMIQIVWDNLKFCRWDARPGWWAGRPARNPQRRPWVEITECMKLEPNMNVATEVAEIVGARYRAPVEDITSRMRPTSSFSFQTWTRPTSSFSLQTRMLESGMSGDALKRELAARFPGQAFIATGWFEGVSPTTVEEFAEVRSTISEGRNGNPLVHPIEWSAPARITWRKVGGDWIVANVAIGDFRRRVLR